MSMYRKIHGQNQFADVLLSAIELTRNDFGRYRDIHVIPGTTDVRVIARIGGASAPIFKTQIDFLRSHENYVKDWTDEDETYLYFQFNMPDVGHHRAAVMAEMQGEYLTVTQMSERDRAIMEAMSREELQVHPRYKDLAKIMQEISDSGDPMQGVFDHDTPEAIIPNGVKVHFI